MNEILVPNARLYAVRRQLEIAAMLGSGKDGIVMVGKLKAQPAKVAIKALRWTEAYEREKKVYERLKEASIASILGFSVPQLVGSDDELRVLEMTIVERPFVLDFAGAYLDSCPQFSEEIWADWEKEKREQFEAHWPRAQAVMDAFEELGIYLLDVTPNNIAFIG